MSVTLSYNSCYMNYVFFLKVHIIKGSGRGGGRLVFISHKTEVYERHVNVSVVNDSICV